MIRQAFDDPATRRLVAVWCAAIFLRLLIMPFTLHMDAYQIYSRAAEAAYGNDWFSWNSQLVIQLAHNVWLLVSRPLLPGAEGIWSETSSIAGVGASPEEYHQFLEYGHIYRAIFLMKLPYFLADLACAYVLVRLVPEDRRIAVSVFWLFNPLVIYSTVVYGRHDVIAILLVLLSYAAARKATDGRRLVGLVLLGLATLARFFPIVLIAPFLLAFKRNDRQLIWAAGILTGMFVLLEAVGIAATGNSPTLEILATHIHFQYTLDANLYLRFDDWIFLFPLVYLVALLWLAERGLEPEEYPTVAASAFLVYFALAFFHPHYAIWLVPFLALTINASRRMIVYHLIQILCIAVYTLQWGSWTTWELLRPVIGDRVAELPDPYDAITAQIEPRYIFGLFRTTLTAVSLWMAWKLIDPLRNRNLANE